MENKLNIYRKTNLTARLKYLVIFSILLIILILPIFQSSYSQWLDAYISDFKVNDDAGTAAQGGGSLGLDSAGNFVITWTDSRNQKDKLFSQKFTKNGSRLGVNFTIGPDSSGGKVNVLPDGRFIMFWQRVSFSYTKLDLYFKRFDINGDSLGSQVKINDTSFFIANGLIYGMDIATDTSGKFIVSWSVKPSLEIYPKIYFQRYDSTGNRIGTLQTVNEANSRAVYPSLAMDKDGGFVICWQDDRYCNYYSKFDVFMQRYNNSGTKIGNNVKVNDDLDTLVDQLGPVISSDGRGYTVIAWADERNEETNIYYQLYDTNGALLGQNRKATIYSGVGLLGVPKVSMRGDRKFFIGWLDVNYASRDQFYGRRFNSNGDTIGMPYMVPMSSPGNSTQMPNSVYLFGDRVYAVWEDTRNGNSDIYCNVRGFQNPDTVIGIKILNNKIPSTFKLFQNYPNPFNPKSNIKFQITKLSEVKLIIFDILGREIAVLVNGQLNPGTYEVEWDASDYPSGVYFYRIKANSFFETKKMILLK